MRAPFVTHERWSGLNAGNMAKGLRLLVMLAAVFVNVVCPLPQETRIDLKWCPRREGRGETPVSCVRPQQCPDTRLLWTGGGAGAGDESRRVAVCGEDGTLVCCLPPPASARRGPSKRRRYVHSPRDVNNSLPEEAVTAEPSPNNLLLQEDDADARGEPPTPKDTSQPNLLGFFSDDPPTTARWGAQRAFDTRVGGPPQGALSQDRLPQFAYRPEGFGLREEGFRPPPEEVRRGEYVPPVRYAPPEEYSPPVGYIPPGRYTLPLRYSPPGEHSPPVEYTHPREHSTPGGYRSRGEYIPPVGQSSSREYTLPREIKLPGGYTLRERYPPRKYSSQGEYMTPRGYAPSDTYLTQSGYGRDTNGREVSKPLQPPTYPYEPMHPTHTLTPTWQEQQQLPRQQPPQYTTHQQPQQPVQFSLEPHQYPSQQYSPQSAYVPGHMYRTPKWQQQQKQQQAAPYLQEQQPQQQPAGYSQQQQPQQPVSYSQDQQPQQQPASYPQDQQPQPQQPTSYPQEPQPQQQQQPVSYPIEQQPQQQQLASYPQHQQPQQQHQLTSYPQNQQPQQQPPSYPQNQQPEQQPASYPQDQQPQPQEPTRYPQEPQPQQPVSYPIEQQPQQQPASYPQHQQQHQLMSYPQQQQSQEQHQQPKSHQRVHYAFPHQNQQSQDKQIPQQYQGPQQQQSPHQPPLYSFEQQSQDQQFPQEQLQQQSIQHEQRQQQSIYSSQQQLQLSTPASSTSPQLRQASQPVVREQQRWQPQVQRQVQTQHRTFAAVGSKQSFNKWPKDRKWDQTDKQVDKSGDKIAEKRMDRPEDKPGNTVYPVGARAAQMCEDYSRWGRRRLQASSLLLDGRPIDVHVSACDKHSPLVVGGQNVTDGEFPHMAAIGFRSGGELGWLCGGTLISEWYVLTAAHCTHTAWGPPQLVRLGSPFLNAVPESAASPVDIDVAAVSVHPGYAAPARYDDIALVRLATPAPTSDVLRPACLPAPEDAMPADSLVVATGWGRLSYAGDTSEVLQKVSLRVSNTQECARVYETDRRSPRLVQGLGSGMLCAGDAHSNRDTCQGDSGGPLQVPLPDNQCAFRVVGITSFGKECGLGLPAVYTRVASYVQWIEDVAWPR